MVLEWMEVFGLGSDYGAPPSQVTVFTNSPHLRLDKKARDVQEIDIVQYEGAKARGDEKNRNPLRPPDPLPTLFDLSLSGLQPVQRKILNEKFHHPFLPNAGMSRIRADLHIETLPVLLQRLDELHRVVRVNVVVRRAVINHQPALQLVGV